MELPIADKIGWKVEYHFWKVLIYIYIFRGYKSLLTSSLWLNVLLNRHLLFTFKSFMSVSDSITCMENLIQSFIFLYGQFLGFKCITSDASHNLEPYKHLISRVVEDIIWLYESTETKELMRQKETFCSNLKRTNFYCFITDKYSKSKIFCFALIFYLQWNLLFA